MTHPGGLIELKEGTVSKNGTAILSGVNLTINKGEKVLLKGESGSGKSTLVKTLLLYEHLEGSLRFNGETVERNNLCQYRREIGYMGQTPPHLDMPVTGFLEMPFGFKSNKSRPRDKEKTLELLRQLNFTGAVLDKNFVDLSGGERQRLLMVQMLLLDKPVYFLDEVTSALDQKNIRAAVSMVCNSPERTVLAIAHNPEWEEFCSRVITMDNGKIVNDTGRTRGR